MHNDAAYRDIMLQWTSADGLPHPVPNRHRRPAVTADDELASSEDDHEAPREGVETAGRRVDQLAHLL